MIERLRGYLSRLGDASSVTYSRFGRPGDTAAGEERPPPTTILVAPFDENDRQHMILGCWHVEKAAASLAAFGISMVVIFFVSSFFEFNWYNHDRGVDVTALLGLFVYLALGVLIHYYVIYGVRNTTPHFLIPFVMIYSVVLTAEAIALIGLLIKMNETMYHQPPPYGSMFLALFVVVGVQTFMLYVVLRCREFLSLRQSHNLEMQVAKKVQLNNPSIEVIVIPKNAGIPTSGSNDRLSTPNNVPPRTRDVNGAYAVDNPTYNDA